MQAITLLLQMHGINIQDLNIHIQKDKYLNNLGIECYGKLEQEEQLRPA